jgi:hypothetical protein
MGYGMQIPAHRVGGPKKLWDFRVYGLSESWVKRVPTVSNVHNNFPDVDLVDVVMRPNLLRLACRDEYQRYPLIRGFYLCLLLIARFARNHSLRAEKGGQTKPKPFPKIGQPDRACDFVHLIFLSFRPLCLSYLV